MNPVNLKPTTCLISYYCENKVSVELQLIEERIVKNEI